MLTIEDCIALSGLTKEEVDAIADHEHLPEIIAAELGNYLLRQADGEDMICKMITDDLDAAREAGQVARAAQLKLVLQHFLGVHPSARGHLRPAAKNPVGH